MAFYYKTHYNSPLYADMNLSGAKFLDLHLLGPVIAYGEEGTAGQVLTAQGGNIPPKWEDAASGGGLPTLGTAGQLLKVNAGATDIEYFTPTYFTLPALTTGSVLFSNGTTIAQDNASFFWDDTNNTLGIGTNTPTTAKLVLADSVLAGSGSLTGGVLNMTQTWNTSGTPTAIKLNVTDTASNSASLLMHLQVGGTNRFSFAKNGDFVASARIDSGSTIRTVASGSFAIISRFILSSATNGNITLLNATSTDFGLVQFGGTSSSFPALKKSSTSIQVRLADDSGDGSFQAKDIRSTGRLMPSKGADVAAANDLTLGADGNVFHITTGAIAINAITTTNWGSGSIVILIFDDSVTVKHNTAGGGGTASMLLAGAADFSATASDTLMLVYDGTRWYEVSRSVN